MLFERSLVIVGYSTATEGLAWLVELRVEYPVILEGVVDEALTAFADPYEE